MESKIQIQPIGIFHIENHNCIIKINQEYRAGLQNIRGFSHLQIVWWGNLSDTPAYRARLVENKPYKKGPDKIGVFATRSQFRPNPVLITTIAVLKIDEHNGLISTPYTDAKDGTPVLDIKPYHLFERVKTCRVPQWCSHWPQWYEDAGMFNWQNEFNFQ